MIIEWSERARKDMKKIEAVISKQIFLAVSDLKNWPACKGIKHLSSHEYPYRLRVGDYRVLFSTETRLKIIKIERVRKRDGNTYK